MPGVEALGTAQLASLGDFNAIFTYDLPSFTGGNFTLISIDDDGETIFGDFTSSVTNGTKAPFDIVLEAVFEGGTGAFDDISGSFEAEGTAKVSTLSPPLPGETDLQIKGDYEL